MSEATQTMRSSISYSLDALEMINFNHGFEAATNALDELSDQRHNEGDKTISEILRWAAKELRGENV